MNNKYKMNNECIQNEVCIGDCISCCVWGDCEYLCDHETSLWFQLCEDFIIVEIKELVQELKSERLSDNLKKMPELAHNFCVQANFSKKQINFLNNCIREECVGRLCSLCPWGSEDTSKNWALLFSTGLISETKNCETTVCSYTEEEN